MNLTRRHVPGLGEPPGLRHSGWRPVCVLQGGWWLRLELALPLLEAKLQAGVGFGFSSEMCWPLTLRPGCGVRAQ